MHVTYFFSTDICMLNSLIQCTSLLHYVLAIWEQINVCLFFTSELYCEPKNCNTYHTVKLSIKESFYNFVLRLYKQKFMVQQSNILYILRYKKDLLSKS